MSTNRGHHPMRLVPFGYSMVALQVGGQVRDFAEERASLRSSSFYYY